MYRCSVPPCPSLQYISLSYLVGRRLDTDHSPASNIRYLQIIHSHDHKRKYLTIRLYLIDAEVGDNIDDGDNKVVIFHEVEGSQGGGAYQGPVY